METKHNAIYNLNFVKVCMMLCVILCHSCAIYTNTKWGGIIPCANNSFLGGLSEYLGTFHTQTFIAISGYLFFLNRYELGKYRKGKQDIVNRSKRLLVPYIFAAIVWVIPAYSLINGFSIRDIFVRFFLATSPAQLWFLICLFVIYIVFYYCSDYILQVNSLLMVAIFIAFYYMGFVANRVGIPNVFQLIKVLQNIIFFYMGFLIRKNQKEISRKTLLLCVVQIPAFIVLFNMKDIAPVFKLLSMVCEPFLSIIGVYIAMSIAALVKNEYSLIKIMAKYSMGIYIIHQQILYVIIRLLNHKMISPYFITGVSFVFAVVLSLGIAWMICKFRRGRFLMGIS